MTVQRFQQRLAHHLQTQGWDLVVRPSDDLDWWADEIWELRSRWPPVGKAAFITFLVDPQWEGSREPGRGVWAVGLCDTMPTDCFEARRLGVTNYLGDKESVPLVLDQLHAFRAR